MNIEVVEFYPIDRNEKKEILTGTLRVKLPDIGIHILGIYVSRRKESWFFSLPGRDGINHETGEKVRYPFIVFNEKNKQHELIDAIRKEGRVFIEQRLADLKKPIIFPKKRQSASKYQEAITTRDIAKSSKETMSNAKPKTKVWVDLPVRKQTKARCVSKFAKQ